MGKEGFHIYTKKRKIKRKEKKDPFSSAQWSGRNQCPESIYLCHPNECPTCNVTWWSFCNNEPGEASCEPGTPTAVRLAHTSSSASKADLLIAKVYGTWEQLVETKTHSIESWKIKNPNPL